VSFFTLSQLRSDVGGRSFRPPATALPVMLTVRRGAPALRHCIWMIVGTLFLGLGGCKPKAPIQAPPADDSSALRQRQFEQLKTYFTVKEKQAQSLAAKDGITLFPEVESYFAAGKKGDWKTVDGLWKNFFRMRSYHDERTKDTVDDDRLKTPYWQTIMETFEAWNCIANTTPKYTQMMADETIRSIPAGSIYLGGTDAGRFLISAMCPSQTEGDPCFIIGQNAVVDPIYLDYVRSMYGGKIQIPTKEAILATYNDFVADSLRRYQHDHDFPNEPRQIKPGENVSMESGHPGISGPLAVMELDALITKNLFDKNPDREFYIEESYPFRWTFPYLEPHGLIMKINRQPVRELSEQLVDADRKYWRNLADGMIGNWLTEATTLQAVTEFASKVYKRKDLRGFTGDPGFVQNDNAMRTFAKFRSSIAGLYAWRIGVLQDVPSMEDYTAKSQEERQRMAAAADFAFRQAFALCPSNPELIFRYTNFLMGQNRAADAILVAQTASEMPSLDEGAATQFRYLLQTLKAYSGRAK